MSLQNGSNINAEHLELLDRLGKDNISVICEIMGSKKFTVKPLSDYLKRMEIKKAIDETNKPLSEIAREVGVSEKTVQRIMKLKKIKK